MRRPFGPRNAPRPCPDAELLALYAERGLGAADRPRSRRTSTRARAARHRRGLRARAARRRRPALSVPGASSVHAGAFGTDGSGGSWFAGWRWLVPITSVAAVALVAVWIGRARRTRWRGKSGPPTSASGARGAGAPVGRPEPPRARRSAARRGAEADTGRQDAARARDAANHPTLSGNAGPCVARTRRRRLWRPHHLPPPRPHRRRSPARRRHLRPHRRRPRPHQRRRSCRRRRAPAQSSLGPAPRRSRGECRRPVAAAKTLDGILTGTVTYRARVALPAGAVVEVRLLDVSRTDAPRRVLGARRGSSRAASRCQWRSPCRTTREAIDPRRRYVVHATITVEGRVPGARPRASRPRRPGGARGAGDDRRRPIR